MPEKTAPSRSEGRDATTPRSITVQTGIIEGHPGSVLYRCGKTEILAVATLQEGTPPWRDDSLGWLTGDYTMLPYATEPRGSSPNDGRIDGRTQEIRRLIGRSLRTSINFPKMPGRTIHLDCSVQRADGGTRTASINAASIALGKLIAREQASGRLPEDPRQGTVLAISVGRIGEVSLVDLDYPEDSKADIDLNVVATPSGDLVEVQGASESKPLPPAVWTELVNLGSSAIAELGTNLKEHLTPIDR